MKISFQLYFFLALATLLFVQCSPKTIAPVIENPVQEDTEAFRKMAPTPSAAPTINIGKSENFTLDNGLDVIVVENHKIPSVSFQLSLKNDPILEGDKVGYVSMAGDLLGRGTDKRTKAEIDEAVDFIGANLSTYGSGIFASSLTKHTSELLKIVTEVLYHPSFPEDELDKIKTRTLSGIQANKSDPNAMIGNLRAKMVYGSDHPYGEVQTERHVENIDMNSIKRYYDQFFIPNNAYLVIVGDVTVQAARDIANKYFGSWEMKGFKPIKHKDVKAPTSRQVGFVHKDGAVQSMINIAYPLDLKVGSEDAIKARVMNSILGVGFSSRLNQNLREDKAFTYGARSSLSADRLAGSFNVSTSVRNEVTDSSITEILYELQRIVTEDVDADELQSIKNYLTGSFARSLESPQTVARFALNIIQYNLPVDYYQKYLENLNSVTVADIRAMAAKYIRPEQAHVLIVGNKDDVSESLINFDDNGVVEYFDAFGDPVNFDVKTAPAGLTAAQVVTDYLNAIGGKEQIKAITNAHVQMSSNMMGQTIVINNYYKDGMYAMSVGNGQLVFTEQKFDGEKVAVSQMGQQQVFTEGEEYQNMKEAANIVDQVNYMDEGYSLELHGIEEVEGMAAYKITVTNPEGTSSTEFYSVENHYLVRDISVQDGPQGSVTIIGDYTDYTSYGNIKVPRITVMTGVMPTPVEMKVESVSFDDLDVSLFSIK